MREHTRLSRFFQRFFIPSALFATMAAKPAAAKPKGPAREPAAPKRWEYRHFNGRRFQMLRAEEHTKSEARARFKARLGLRRLPIGALVQRVG